jgi:hypothetical protein
VRRSRRAVLALALAWVGLVPGAPSQAAGPCVGTSDAGGGWVASRPAFTAGAADVTLAVSPSFAPDVIYATNGAVIVRSEDAGCTWAPSFAASTAKGPVGAPQITSLAAPSSANSSSYVYAGVTVDVGNGVTLPRVVASSDRGRNWAVSAATSGMAAAGAVTEVAANPLVPQTAYAVVALGLGSGRATVYATTDGGANWAERTAPGREFTGSHLVANPLTQTQLFALDGQRVVRSGDGAATFAPTAGDSGSVGALRLASGAGGARLVAARTDTNAVERTDDNAAVWRTVAVPIRAQSVAMAPLQDLVAVSDDKDAYLVGAFGTVGVSPAAGAPGQLTLSAPTASGFSVTGVRSGQVLRLVLTVGGTPKIVVPRGLRPVTLLPPGALAQFPSLLLPSTLRVALPAGGTTRVPYQLLLPRTPTPVDLMFLIDTTGSMGGVIDGLRQDLGRIVGVLNTAGLDARFGVAEFRDYGKQHDKVDYPYLLRRTIGPSDAYLRAALNALNANGGGDGPEAGLTALLQSSTGQGQEGFVDPGGQAQYRPQAFKLALISTDTKFHRAGDDFSDSPGLKKWPGPSFDETVAALNSAGVHQIGLAASKEPMSDMQSLALSTDALAPKGGVDCNGDGLVDVTVNGPLVCELQTGVVSSPVGGPSAGGGTALAGAVVGVANGITDQQPVKLRVSQGSAHAQLRTTPRSSVVVAPTTVLNLKADNELAYELELHCPVAGAASYPVALTASTPLRTLANASVQLDCGGSARRGRAGHRPRAGPARAAAAAEPEPQPEPEPERQPAGRRGRAAGDQHPARARDRGGRVAREREPGDERPRRRVRRYGGTAADRGDRRSRPAPLPGGLHLREPVRDVVRHSPLRRTPAGLKRA